MTLIDIQAPVADAGRLGSGRVSWFQSPYNFNILVPEQVSEIAFK